MLYECVNDDHDWEPPSPPPPPSFTWRTTLLQANIVKTCKFCWILANIKTKLKTMNCLKKSQSLWSVPLRLFQGYAFLPKIDKYWQPTLTFLVIRKDFCVFELDFANAGICFYFAWNYPQITSCKWNKSYGTQLQAPKLPLRCLYKLKIWDFVHLMSIKFS